MCPCVGSVSGERTPEAAVVHCSVGSFDFSTAVVRLVQRGLLRLHVLVVLLDSVFEVVLNVFQIVGVSRVVRSNW